MGPLDLPPGGRRRNNWLDGKLSFHALAKRSPVMQAATGEAADTRPGSSRHMCGQASVRPYLGPFSANLKMRSLREAAEDAQPLPGTSAGTRGHWSQPRACHENLGG